MEPAPVSRRTTGWTAGRVLIGLLILAPFLILTWAAAAVNVTYFRDEWDPVTFWLHNLTLLSPVFVVAGLTMFLRFRSPRSDKVATLVGLPILVAVMIFLVLYP